MYPEVRVGFGVFMSEALELAARARGRTSPNPMVGAVVVRDGQVVGRGYHPRAGEPHAEILALREAGERARGATLILNLEPCSHFGRTPPCAPAVIEAGITKVAIGMEDPNPLVAGAGLRLLRERGIEVQVGVMETEARQLNEAFIKRVTSGLPFLELKVAMTLDGKIATRTGRSRWITGAAAREWVHQRRDQADAVLVGANTVRVDNPQLTVRPAPSDGRQPLRCVITASGALPPDANVLMDKAAETVVFGGVRRRESGVGGREMEGADTSLDAQNDKTGRVSWINVEPDTTGEILEPALRSLADRGINEVLVEGGAQLNASLLSAGLVDRVSAFVAPKLFGGSGPGGFGELGVCDPSQAVELQDLTVQQIGNDWLFRGRPCSPA